MISPWRFLATGFFGLAMAAGSATFDATDYGAAADGLADDTAAIQKAIDDAAEAGRGNVVHLPAGRYRIDGTLVVRPNTTLQGDFRGPATNRGTILLATGGRGHAEGPGCLVLKAGATVRGVSIRYPEQSAEAAEPVPYPWAIRMGAYTRLEDVHIDNPYLGIDLDGAHAAFVRNITGEPLKIGIHADHIHDICRIENVHFWPYFTNGKPLRDWVQAHGVAFEFGRSDWQYCFNTFSYGYHTGYRFYRSEDVPGTVLKGGTTNGNFVGIGADRCIIGIDVEAAFEIGVSITNGEFAPFGSAEARGVFLRETNRGNLSLVNCNFWAVPNLIAEVRGGSLNLVGCNLHEWAVHRKGRPAILVTGGRINVNGCVANRGGLLARLEGAGTRALFTGNMGTSPWRIENGIGDRARFGANNPPFEVKEP